MIATYKNCRKIYEKVKYFEIVRSTSSHINVPNVYIIIDFDNTNTK